MVCAVARLFTPEIASFYENVYRTKGVTFVKGTVVESFEGRPSGDVGTHNPIIPSPHPACQEKCISSVVPVWCRWVWWS